MKDAANTPSEKQTLGLSQGLSQAVSETLSAKLSLNLCFCLKASNILDLAKKKKVSDDLAGPSGGESACKAL